MNQSRNIRYVLSIFVACAFLLAAPGEGWFGITISTKGSGAFWDPTVDSMTISKIAPNSPAENQHLSVGDTILEIEGIQVSGTKGKLLKLKIQKSVGENLRLKIRKQNGEIYSTVLTAAAMP